MVLKIVMYVVDGSVGPFANQSGFIDEKIYLPWYAFAHNSKNAALARCFEKDPPRLHGVAGNIDSLCIVEGIVYCCI